MLDFGITEYTLDNYHELLIHKSSQRSASSQTGYMKFRQGEKVFEETCDEAIWWFADFFAWRWVLNPNNPTDVSFEQYQQWRLSISDYSDYGFFFENMARFARR